MSQLDFFEKAFAVAKRTPSLEHFNLLCDLLEPLGDYPEHEVAQAIAHIESCLQHWPDETRAAWYGTSRPYQWQSQYGQKREWWPFDYFGTMKPERVHPAARLVRQLAIFIYQSGDDHDFTTGPGILEHEVHQHLSNVYIKFNDEHGFGFGENICETLAMPHFAQIQHIKFEEVVLYEASLVQMIQTCTSLKSLTLLGLGGSEYALMEMLRQPEFSTLISLCAEAHTVVEFVADSGDHLTHLKQLSLPYALNQRRYFDLWMRFAQSSIWPQLTHLDFSNNNLSDAEMMVFLNAVDLSNLEAFNLSNNDVLTKTIECLSDKEKYPKLAHVIMDADLWSGVKLF